MTSEVGSSPKPGARDLGHPVVIGIERIQTEEEIRTLETESVYTTIVEPKDTNRLLKFVQAKLPKLNNIEHVKRIKRVQNEQGATELHVILCQSSSIGRQELVDRLAEFDPEWKSGEMILGEAAVPKHAPCTNEQYEEWKKIWPITFKNPTYKRADVSDAGEREYINRYMQLAFEQARQASESGNRYAGAVIVRPGKSSTVVTMSGDLTGTRAHPLKHAVINCVESMGRMEQEKRASVSSHKRKLDEVEEANPGTAVVTTTTAAPAAEIGESEGYLCTGMDVFVSYEPCIMCCMGLVHSRIGRLFFGQPAGAKTQYGSLTAYRIHCKKGLNHHFSTFKCIVEDQAP